MQTPLLRHADKAVGKPQGWKIGIVFILLIGAMVAFTSSHDSSRTMETEVGKTRINVLQKICLMLAGTKFCASKADLHKDDDRDVQFKKIGPGPCLTDGRILMSRAETLELCMQKCAGNPKCQAITFVNDDAQFDVGIGVNFNCENIVGSFEHSISDRSDDMACFEKVARSSEKDATVMVQELYTQDDESPSDETVHWLKDVVAEIMDNNGIEDPPKAKPESVRVEHHTHIIHDVAPPPSHPETVHVVHHVSLPPPPPQPPVHFIHHVSPQPEPVQFLHFAPRPRPPPPPQPVHVVQVIQPPPRPPPEPVHIVHIAPQPSPPPEPVHVVHVVQPPPHPPHEPVHVVHVIQQPEPPKPNPINVVHVIHTQPEAPQPQRHYNPTWMTIQTRGDLDYLSTSSKFGARTTTSQALKPRKYLKRPRGHACDKGRIATENECEEAAQEFGHPFSGIVDDRNLPPGCNFKRHEVRFNKNLNARGVDYTYDEICIIDGPDVITTTTTAASG